MEFNFDVLWIVIVIIGWVISAANKANKKQQEQKNSKYRQKFFYRSLFIVSWI